MLNFDARRKLPTLLLIDDDLVSREVTATVLTMNGYNVHTAEGGAAATAMLDAAECKPDVILMDAQMPGLNGVALLAALRQRVQASIYAISASRLPDELAEAADGFLVKPFNTEALEHLLSTRKSPAPATGTGLLEPTSPVVNAETLAQLRVMMSAAAVHEIYMAVVADLEKRMKMLEGAIGRSDMVEIRRIGHTIKGGCGMVGAMQAARIGALFEEASYLADGNQLDNSMALLRELRSATHKLERMLENELQA